MELIDKNRVLAQSHLKILKIREKVRKKILTEMNMSISYRRHVKSTYSIGQMGRRSIPKIRYLLLTMSLTIARLSSP